MFHYNLCIRIISSHSVTNEFTSLTIDFSHIVYSFMDTTLKKGMGRGNLLLRYSTAMQVIGQSEVSAPPIPLEHKHGRGTH